MKVYYDEGWAARFKQDSVNAVRRVMAHFQNILMWPSLTTKVYLDINPDVRALPGTWNTSEYSQ